MPKPLPGTKWQLKFKVAEKFLRDPELKSVPKVALEKGMTLS
jgi:hypothetical protein